MSLTNAEFEWEFFKALLSDPYNPEASVLLKLDELDITTVNRPFFSYLRDTFVAYGCLDAGSFVELASDHDMDQVVRTRLMDLVSTVYDVPFPLARMAKKMLTLKNRTLAAGKAEKALKGPTEDLESGLRDALSHIESASPLDEAPTLRTEWERVQSGQSLPDPHQIKSCIYLGLAGIDNVLQSGPGNIGVIAAKPSAGKSSLALQAALVSAREGIKVLFLGLEMSRLELAARAIAWEVGASSFDISRGYVPALGEPPVWIDNLFVYDRIPKGSFDEACKLINQAVRLGVRLVVVDYWTLIYPPDTKVRGAGSAYLLGEMSRGFKQLSKELQIHIVLVSQFNRDVKEAERPSLENLRETGQLEQDASWVLMLWNGSTEFGPYDNRGIWAELQKNRGGPRWVKVYTEFHPDCARFFEAKAPEFTSNGKTKMRGALS